MTEKPLKLKTEDQPSESAAPRDAGDEDDFAIALDIKELGDIEAKIFVMNGHCGEARQAVRAALNLIQSPQARRLLHQSQRAMDDAIKVGLNVVNQTRGL